mgnify:CR=1 FL=1
MATKSNNYGKGVKSNQRTVVQPSWGKFWLGMIAFILVAAILVGVMGWRTDGFKDWTFGFGEKPPVVNELGEPNNLVVTALNDDTPIEVTVMPYASTASTGTFPSEYQVTAQVKPDDATIKEILFELDWAYSDDNDWDYSQKVVEDYVTMTKNVYATGDTRQTVTLKAKAPFGEPMHLKMTSVSNPEVTAVCVVDYVKRLKTVTAKFVDESGAEVTEIDIVTGKRVRIVPEYTYGVGTVTGDFYIGRTYLTIDPSRYVQGRSEWNNFRFYNDLTNCFDWNEYVEFVPLENNRYEAEGSTGYIDLSMLNFLYVSDWNVDDWFVDPNDNPSGEVVTEEHYFNYLKNDTESMKLLKQVWYAMQHNEISGTLLYSYRYDGKLVTSSNVFISINFQRSNLITPVTGIETTTPSVPF